MFQVRVIVSVIVVGKHNTGRHYLLGAISHIGLDSSILAWIELITFVIATLEARNSVSLTTKYKSHQLKFSLEFTPIPSLRLSNFILA